ncbi:MULTISPECIES: diacylglycerol kinase family protein [Anaeromyxobacter]|uniref:diacylglycerol/lipid kinase family protein n=1 Tax=Anaeromyxobacter TaxID=161492 RepID=UPI001F5AF08F|nr:MULTISPECIES: diacylglycerol kinase family protein [unclassified Anaeromyxobacter]
MTSRAQVPGAGVRAPAGLAAARSPARRCLVILNARAGGAGTEDVAGRVRAALAAAGVDARVVAAEGDIGATARAAASDAEVDAVVAAGGDGTVSAVAGGLAGTPKPLGVLPLGTLNHFAKDLGLPADLEEAARVIASGAQRRVDVAEVNGRVFVNNSSIGIYPHAVRERERTRRRLGKWIGKWLAMAWAALRVLVRLRPLSVRIRWDGGAGPRRTTFVFVGNNRYDTALVATQRRAALDRGTLGVYVATAPTRLGLLRLGARALVGRVDPGRDVEALEVASVAIESHHRRLAVSVDGEVISQRPPIRYRIRPGALTVLAP